MSGARRIAVAFEGALGPYAVGVPCAACGAAPSDLGAALAVLIGDEGLDQCQACGRSRTPEGLLLGHREPDGSETLFVMRIRCGESLSAAAFTP